MIKKIIKTILINILAIYLAVLVIDGFQAPLQLYSIVIISLIFTSLNIIVWPVRFILTPITWITLGVSSFIINLSVMTMLDYLIKDVIITGLDTLIITTIFITFINFICHRFLSLKS